MTDEERKYKIFKIFYYNSEDEQLIKKLGESITKYKFINSVYYDTMKEGILANAIAGLVRENRDKYSKVMLEYKILLEKMSYLAKELNLQNSLELNILFSYLLWNGYLSKNKEYRFNSNDKKNIPGLFFADIMDGFGVCLNNSEMLKDFLNHNGYISSLCQNFFNNKSEVNNIINIERKNDEVESKKNLIERILKRKPNHVFNIIEDSNQLYIYDSTNLLLHKIINPYESTLINGKGNFKLFPYQSYMNCANSQEIELLDKLITTDNYSSPYTKEDLISTSEIILEIIQSSRTLLEEFYTDVRPNILCISEMTDKIKSRNRIR